MSQSKKRTQRLVRWGVRAVEKERGAYWVFALVCHRLSEVVSDEVGAEQFDTSADTYRNARLAYQLYADMRAVPKLCCKARALRKARDKSIWEVEALHYSRHHSLPDAVDNMLRNVELSVRDYKAAADERYLGAPLPRELAKQEQRVAELMQDIWAEIDKLPEDEQPEPVRLATRAERAGKLWVGRLAEVRDGLSGSSEPF